MFSLQIRQEKMLKDILHYDQSKIIQGFPSFSESKNDSATVCRLAYIWICTQILKKGMAKIQDSPLILTLLFLPTFK